MSTLPIINLAVETHDTELHEALINFGVFHSQCFATARWMMNDGFIWPIRSTISESHKVVQAMVSRAARWMHSMGQLQWPDDYQAFSAGCRALLETAADITLITHDPTLIERLHAWEESAKLKLCERQSQSNNGGAAASAVAAFIANNSVRIKADRVSRWGTTKHPRTWFGPNLEQLLAAADKLAGTDFELTYTNNYDRLCLGTHGSGLVFEKQSRSFMVTECCASMVVALKVTNDLAARALDFLGEDRQRRMNQLAAAMYAAETAFRAALFEAIARRAGK